MSPGEVASVPVGSRASRGPLPLWPRWLASVPVWRRTAAHCGVTQLPRPQQETFARVSTTSEVSAASVADPPQVAARKSPFSNEGHTCEATQLEKDVLWWLWFRRCVYDMCLIRSKTVEHLIVGAVSLWTRLPGHAPVCSALKTHPISSSPP